MEYKKSQSLSEQAADEILDMITIKKQFKILDFSGKKIYLEKGASDSIFEISDTMEELLFLLKDGITLEEIYKYFLKQYAVNDEYLRAAISSTIDILSKKGIIERYVSK